jgi:peroxiredoxin/outer membrane lipoprotein-sorting protein
MDYRIVAGQPSHRVGHGRKRVCFQLLVAMCVLLALCPHGWSQEPNVEERNGAEWQRVDIDRAELILRRTDSAYKTIQTYQDETSVTIRRLLRGREQTVEVRYRVTFERPNKVALVRTGGRMLVICDGEKLYTYLAPIGKYSVEEAPQGIEGILEANPFGLGWEGAAPLKVLSLFGDNPYKTMMEDVVKVELVADETLDGAKTHHVVLHRESGTVDLWIDSDDYLIRKMRVDLSEAATMPGVGSIVIDEAHDNVRTGGEIPPDTFVFRPPAGTEQTDDLLAELYGGPQLPSPLVGKKAPDFTLSGLKERSSIRLSDYAGKVVMLEFWTTDCPACLMEMPALQKMYEEYKGQGFVLVGVNDREASRTAADFMDRRKFTFPVALDTSSRVGSLYRVTGRPTLVVIDKKGMVRNVHVGYAPGLERRFEKELKRLLSE